MQKKTKHQRPYVERDISWMYFNRRILYEAERADIPLLERVNFLGIYSNNLDEFFMVRVASLRRIIDAEGAVSAPKRKLAERTLKEIYRLNEEYAKHFSEVMESLFKQLEQEGIRVLNETQLSQKQKQQVEDFYMKNLATSTIPLFLRRDNLSDDEIDESLYLAVDLSRDDAPEGREGVRHDAAIVRIPVESVGRFIRLPDDEEGNVCLMFLDDLLRVCMPYIFMGLGYTHFEAYTFKFTKDAEMGLSDDFTLGHLQKVSKAIRKRRKGDKLRIVFDKTMPSRIRNRLFKRAELDRYDAKIWGGRYHNTRDFMHFPSCGRYDLLNAPQPSIVRIPNGQAESLFDRIRRGDMLLHFPYHSFDIFVRLLREAAIRDDVKELKVTLYRVARNSHVINAMIAAAKNGVKVTAVIELMARFDEERNISWSQELIDAGVNVVFGPEQLKIHCKLVHIVTSDGDLACVSTGNMHEGTAKVYSDYMLMTADRAITSEVDDVFTFIESPFLTTHFKSLLVSPNDMRQRVGRLIDRETRNHLKGLPAYIRVKINHIVDPKIIAKLYAASQAGVPVDLVVRGNCSLVPGVRGVSENIRVNGIIDRYLEHERILAFCNNGQPEVYIGSADWMERNLDRRIEVMCPIYSPALQADLLRTIDYGLRDVAHGHYVNEQDGKPRRFTAEQPWFASQSELYRVYRDEAQNEE